MNPWKPTLKGFARAAWLSLKAHWRVSPRRAFVKAIQTGIFLATHWFRPRVKEFEYRQREASCKACPIYNPSLQTCGTPGGTFKSALYGSQPLGCWCYMPTKAKLRVNCWAWKNGYRYGWPIHLNEEFYDGGDFNR